MRKEAEVILSEAAEIYGKEFKDSEKYVIHRDLHQYNILDDGERFYGVDPVGNIAPKEFECVRYIRNDLRGKDDYSGRYKTLIKVFGQFADPLRITLAFIIDAAFHVVSSTFENEEKTETVFTLDVIKAAKDYAGI